MYVIASVVLCSHPSDIPRLPNLSSQFSVSTFLVPPRHTYLHGVVPQFPPCLFGSWYDVVPNNREHDARPP